MSAAPVIALCCVAGLWAIGMYRGYRNAAWRLIAAAAIGILVASLVGCVDRESMQVCRQVQE